MGIPPSCTLVALTIARRPTPDTKPYQTPLPTNPSNTAAIKNGEIPSSGHKIAASHHRRVRPSPIGIGHAPIIAAPRAPSASVNGGATLQPRGPGLTEMKKMVRIHQSVA
jgi:hypothetical protein